MLEFAPNPPKVPVPIPQPRPAPPIVPPLTPAHDYWRRVEEWINYLRSLRLLPNNVTTPPNNWPGSFGGLAGSTLFWLIWYELSFPRPAGRDSTQDKNPVRLDPGLQPAQELESPGFVIPRGTSSYVGLRRVDLFYYLDVEQAPACPGGFAEPGKILQEGNRSVSISAPVDGTVEIENNSPRLNLNCGGSSANNDIVSEYPMRIRTLDSAGMQVGDWITPLDPWDSGEFFEASNSGGRTRVVYVTEFDYDTRVEDYPPDRQPGPIVPQPNPFPDPAPIPTPRTYPLPAITEPLPGVALVAPAPGPATVRKRVAPASAEPLTTPPLPADFPIVAPDPIPLPGPAPATAPIPQTDVQEIGLNGLPVPLPPTKTAVTDPTAHFPWPGADPVFPAGVRGDLTAIGQEVGRIEQKTAQIGTGLNGLGGVDWGALLDLLQLLLVLFEQDVPATSYELTGVCETPDDEGNQPVFTTPIGSQPYTEAVIARLDAMQHLFQAHLGYKTPTCGSTKQPLEGELRSIRFVSDAPSPYSNRPLRKLLRYRSKSGQTSSGLGAYWGSFTWQAGPVCVIHKGSWWGVPQVWAQSADEGKRVIRHAAGEARIDPDTDGEWVVTSSGASRYGMPGTMRVDEIQGIPWATARKGPSGFPEL